MKHLNNLVDETKEWPMWISAFVSGNSTLCHFHIADMAPHTRKLMGKPDKTKQWVNQNMIIEDRSME
jgi:hypothetical protein